MGDKDLREYLSVKGGVNLIRKYPALESIPYWIAAILTSLAAIFYSKIFDLTTSLSKFTLTYHPYWYGLIFAPGGFALSTWLVLRLAPTSGGSGIPQVMASMEMDSAESLSVIKNLLGLRTIVVKFFSSLIGLAAGGILGREGPTVQIGASIFRLFGSRFQKVWSTASIHNWILAGAAAGIAAAFNTPLGGIVFAVEELSGRHFSKFKTSIISAVVIAGITTQLLSGPYLYFGYPEINAYEPNVLLWVALLSSILGVMGGAMVKILIRMQAPIRKMLLKQRILFAAICGLALGILGISLGTAMIGGGSEIVKEILFSKTVSPGWPIMVARYFGLCVTYLVGMAGGIFAPSLSIGGIAGAELAGWLGVTGHQNLFVLTGMAAFLAAITGAPFTASVLVFEMTDRHSAILPTLIAAVCGAIAAKLTHPETLYHAQAEIFLEQVKAEPVPVAPG